VKIGHTLPYLILLHLGIICTKVELKLMEKSSETKFLIHLAVPECYSRWGWYFVAGSPWSIPVVGPPQLSEGFTISNCETL